MKYPSLRFQTFSKMCFLEWINLHFVFNVQEELLEFLDTDKILAFPYLIPGKGRNALAEIV